MQSTPLAVSTQPHLGELRLWTTPGDTGRPSLVDPTVALRVEVAELSLRLSIVETYLARPWWGARAWAWLRAHVEPLLQQLAERRRR